MIASVTPDSFASKIGLKAGDRIIRINDRQVTNDRTYDESLWTAVRFLDGYVDLVILDGNTGRTHHRTGYLNSGSDLRFPQSAPEFHTRDSALL